MDMVLTPEVIPMDPGIARRLFEECAFLIIAGVPIGTEFGIDLSSYTVGELFRGIKMIPTGPHFVFTASKGPYNDTAPRVGFIHYFKPKEIVIREWDDEKEELRVRTKIDPDVEKKRIQDNIKDLDRYLGAYDYQMLPKWKELTNYITEETIEKLAPTLGTIRTCAELLSCPDAERPRGELNYESRRRNFKIRSLADEDMLLPDLKAVPGTAPNFTVLPDRCPKTATPAEVTINYMDSYVSVDKLLSQFHNYNDLISEIQFAFVCFMVGYSIDGLIHWRRIVHLLSNSEKSANNYKEFYIKLINILIYHLPELPIEFIESSDKNTIYLDIKNLLKNSINIEKLRGSTDLLINSVKNLISWNFDDLYEEDPDDLPVVVDLDNN